MKNKYLGTADRMTVTRRNYFNSLVRMDWYPRRFPTLNCYPFLSLPARRFSGGLLHRIFIKITLPAWVGNIYLIVFLVSRRQAVILKGVLYALVDNHNRTLTG